MTGKIIERNTNILKSQIGYDYNFWADILKEENVYLSINHQEKYIKIIYTSTTLDDSSKHINLVLDEPLFKFFTSKEYLGYFQFALPQKNENALLFLKEWNN